MYLPLTLALSSLVLFGMVYSRFRNRALAGLRVIESRTPIPLERLHSEHFPDLSLDEFLKLWNGIAFHLDIPPEHLRPGDRFDIELEFLSSAFVIDRSVELNQWVAREMKLKGVSAKPGQLHTLEEVVRILS